MQGRSGFGDSVKLSVGNVSQLAVAKNVKFGARGIDKLAFTFKAAKSSNFNASHWYGGGPWRSATQPWTTLGMSSHYLALYANPAGMLARVELTPALFLGRPNNLDVPEDGCARLLAETAVNLAEELAGLIATESLDEMRVTRLDLVQDLRLDTEAILADFLAARTRLRLPYSKEITTRFSKQEVSSVTAGNGSRSLRLYDKYRESGDPSTRGTCRWECQLRRSSLETLGLRKLAHLSAARIKKARTKLWSWSRMDSPLLAPPALFEALSGLAGAGVMTTTTMWTLLGGLFCDFSGASTRTRQRYERILRDHGIQVDLTKLREVAVQDSTRTYIADYKAGRILVKESRSKD